jgi:hypothetical protein
MIVLYLFLGWLIPTVIHIIWLYYDMEKGESIEEFVESKEKEDIIIVFIPVLNILIMIAYFMLFIIDFVYNKIKYWRK